MSNNLEIIYKKSNIQNFEYYWNEFLSTYEGIPYCYTIAFLEYMNLYSKNLIEDKSFVVIQNGKCIGICYLPIENINGIPHISLSGSYTFAPFTISLKIEKEMYSIIEDISYYYGVKKIMFQFNSLQMEYLNKYNKLRAYKYLDTTESDCILDVRPSERELWSGVRKGHKHAINKILKDESFEVICYDKSNISIEMSEKYRLLHIKCAGRETRGKNTFYKQYEMIKKDMATLFALLYNGKQIGFCYFIHFQKTVVYLSAADDPDFNNFSIYHSIIWEAIKYYNKKGYDFMQFQPPCGYSYQFDNYIDKKQVNISSFKRGFGLKSVHMFRGIKYFDKELFNNDIDHFKKMYLETINEN